MLATYLGFGLPGTSTNAPEQTRADSNAGLMMQSTIPSEEQAFAAIRAALDTVLREPLLDDAVIYWEDKGATLCLRPQNPHLTTEARGWFNPGLGQFSTGGCTWSLGVQTMVNVVAWIEGQQLEGSTIKFVNSRHPEIPTTEIIYEWIDHAGGRSFMITRRAPGILLDDARHSMTEGQRRSVADEVAIHVKTLAQHTSCRLESIDEFGVQDTDLIGSQQLRAAINAPSWKLFLHRHIAPEVFAKHLAEASNMTSFPDIGPEGDEWCLAQMTYWKCTAYWPRYWVATAPGEYIQFTVRVPGKPVGHWDTVLYDALVRAGFESMAAWDDELSNTSEELRVERAGTGYEEWVE
ncbi:hypothetical protein MMC17_009514 [Xylographa soralifera]|nr:hypothetical protein [Xylographa soralifera]